MGVQVGHFFYKGRYFEVEFDSTTKEFEIEGPHPRPGIVAAIGQYGPYQANSLEDAIRKAQDIVARIFPNRR